MPGVIDLRPSDENRLVQQTVREFAEAEILPYIREWDANGEVHREVFERMAELGLLGAPIHTRWGGSGMDYVSFAMICEELERAEARGLEVVDGTCPYVKYPQAIAQRLSAEGYHVVIVGDADHAEIKGVVSYSQGPCTVVKPGGPIPEIKAKKVAVIAQTTCIGAEFERVVGILALRHKEVRAVNTICNDTEERQEDARSLAREVDAIVVVGGKNSANTRHLAEICRALQPRTWHVETENELDPAWFEGCRVVGLSAGASTPDWVVQGVATWLRALA